MIVVFGMLCVYVTDKCQRRGGFLVPATSAENFFMLKSLSPSSTNSPPPQSPGIIESMYILNEILWEHPQNVSAIERERKFWRLWINKRITFSSRHHCLLFSHFCVFRISIMDTLLECGKILRYFLDWWSEWVWEFVMLINELSCGWQN